MPTNDDLINSIILESWKAMHPHWFNYSDTLGERPIDGFIREYQRREQQKQESMDYEMLQLEKDAGNRNNNLRVMQNQEWNYDPGYVKEGKVGSGTTF